MKNRCFPLSVLADLETGFSTKRKRLCAKKVPFPFALFIAHRVLSAPPGRTIRRQRPRFGVTKRPRRGKPAGGGSRRCKGQARVRFPWKGGFFQGGKEGCHGGVGSKARQSRPRYVCVCPSVGLYEQRTPVHLSDATHGPATSSDFRGVSKRRLAWVNKWYVKALVSLWRAF